MSVQCKLCLEFVDELQDSHYIPAGVYRALRVDPPGNINPYKVGSEFSVQTSEQMTAHLLCKSCEGRFNKYGEDWVLRNSLRKNGTFPLRMAIQKGHLLMENSEGKIFSTHGNTKVNVQALVYFAVSVFWRGSIYAWNDNNTVPVQLGKHQEQFRLYLLGLSEFPDDCGLTVIISDENELNYIVALPFGQIRNEECFYRFSIPAIGFILFCGKSASDDNLAACIFRGKDGPIYLSSILEKRLLDEAVNTLRVN